MPHTSLWDNKSPAMGLDGSFHLPSFVRSSRAISTQRMPVGNLCTPKTTNPNTINYQDGIKMVTYVIKMVYTPSIYLDNHQSIMFHLLSSWFYANPG
jgi:hypothetical protein